VTSRIYLTDISSGLTVSGTAQPKTRIMIPRNNRIIDALIDHPRPDIILICFV